MSEITVHIENLTKKYGAFTALDDISADLLKGRIVGLLGSNGSGKTTLIKTLAGLLCKSAGKVDICGIAPSYETKSFVSYLPDKDIIEPSQKISGCLDLYEYFFTDFDRPRAEDMLNNLGLDTAKTVKQLSKGNKEKLQLILAMSRRAKLYLLDEPIAGVDPAARDYILNTIISNYDREATILISTHLIYDVEPVLDDFIFLHDGRIVMQGSVDDVRSKYGKSLDIVFREVFRCY